MRREDGSRTLLVGAIKEVATSGGRRSPPMPTIPRQPKAHRHGLLPIQNTQEN